MKSSVLGVFVCVALAAPVVDAAESKVMSFDVYEGATVVHELTIHAQRGVVLYFPAKVDHVAWSEASGLEVQIEDYAVKVSPRARTDTRALLHVTCQGMLIGVQLVLADDWERVYLAAVFHNRDAEARFEDEVAAESERRIRAMRDQHRKAMAALEFESQELARSLITQAFLERRGVAPVHEVGRNGDHVVVRAREFVWAGNDLYVYFEVQNRVAESYRLDRVSAVVDGAERAGETLFSRLGTPAGPGALMRGQRGKGVVCLRNAALWMGEHIELRFMGGGAGSEPVVLDLTVKE
ncbi:hypothetical protein [Haliangium sp.]|uniref:hypothetical protein n=1 Tax=Haliangium sp. TaxID=2663208 RepID=UPI003D0C7699